MKKKPVNKKLVTYMGLTKPVTREPSKNHTLMKNEKVLTSMYLNKNHSVFLIEFQTLTGDFMYKVQEQREGKKNIIAIRDGKNAAYQVYHRLEKKLTGWG